MARTYNDVYLTVRRLLKQRGIGEYALEARRITAHAAGLAEAALVARLGSYAPPETERYAAELTARRLTGEPLAYITGFWEFFGLPFLVNPSVLIPRMDTEVLVSTALGLLRDGGASPRILDLCCGSGCIGCALARQIPSARVVLADISPQALALCRKNVSLNRLAPRCICLEADVRQGPPLPMGQFDLVVSNPPYIPTGELESLDASVRDWEPMLALDGGQDGLDFYDAILDRWQSVLSDGGCLILEVGEGQAEPVRARMEQAGFRDVGGAFDTIGVERVVYGRKYCFNFNISGEDDYG